MLLEGSAEHVHRLRPHAVQLHDLGLVEFGELVQVYPAAPASARRAGADSLGRSVSPSVSMGSSFVLDILAFRALA
jgi:hypothetical protein